MFYKIFDYFFLIRPAVLIPCWTFILLGHRYAGGFYFPVRPFILYSAIMGGVYILNQVFDIESDRRNKKLFLLSGGYISVTSAIIELFGLWSLGLLLTINFSWSFRWLVIISLLMGILYSLPPIKLKGRPFLDLLSNSLGYGLVSFLVGTTIEAPVQYDTVLYSIPYILAVGGVFINTTIVDIEGDRLAGEVTTTILIGKKSAYLLALILIASSLCSAILVKNYPCLITATVSLPFFIMAILKRDKRWTTISFRVPPFILALCAGYFYPVYLVLLLLLIGGMRLYYKKRFGYSYPDIAEA